jgi:hypothetical protein
MGMALAHRVDHSPTQLIETASTPVVISWLIDPPTRGVSRTTPRGLVLTELGMPSKVVRGTCDWKSVS